MANRVKVVHVITRLDLGGAQQNTLYCCAHHDRKKYDVVLICGVGGYLEGQARKIKNLKTYFLPSLKHPIRPWWDVIAVLRIVTILWKEKAQVVHTHSSKAGLLGRWASKLSRVPVIIHTVHGWGFYDGQFFLVRWLYIFLEKITAPMTDRLITVSAHNRDEGLRLGIGKPDQYEVIHSGIDVKQYQLLLAQARRARKQLNPENRPVVLVLSNFKKQKSPFDVVTVAKKVKQDLPLVLFLWAGDGPLKERIEAKINEEGLSQNFLLLGWREDVAQLLAASNAMLLTSIYEGLPRVVLQAMAAGKPVVATSVNGTPEAVQTGVNGYLARPHDTDHMAQALTKLLADKALARKIGQAGQRSLKGSFLIGEMLRQIEVLYEKALSKGQ